MRNQEREENRAIREFIKQNRNTSQDLFDFFKQQILIADEEVHRVARNVINIVLPYYLSLSKTKKVHLLKALAKLFEIAEFFSFWEYQLFRKDASLYYKDMPTYFSRVTHVIGALEVMRNAMALVDKKKSDEKVVLVEGESEANFIETLAERASFDFPVYNYQGKGNVQNLDHYVKEKNRQGVKVLLTYDKDNRSESFLQRFKKKKCKIEAAFGFRKDFESSFPPHFLKRALEIYTERYCGHKIKITVPEIRSLLGGNAPFLKLFEQKHGFTLSKAKLGRILGKIMRNLLQSNWEGVFSTKTKPFSAEIFKFMRFLAFK